ncbi:MAG: hypothetical protein H6509_07110 [Bryobacterales bacterium]|nr:hypothetical protein [Acidobacteriota bacterium]MCB9384367.1 hypothetical protein [Bryobacterales bacterium]
MDEAAIREPMTLATDYALAALGVYFGLRLLRSDVRARRLWAYAFLAMAAGALFGGTAHGFAEWFSPAQAKLVWKATTYSIGLASFFLLAATGAGALPCRWSRVVMTVAAVKLAVYLWWMASHDAFVYVIYDYGPSMLAVLAGHLWAWRARGADWAKWIAAGVVVSFVGAGVQMSGFALAEHFNHNDLYHVIQMAGLWLFWRGARRIGEKRPFANGSSLPETVAGE